MSSSETVKSLSNSLYDKRNYLNWSSYYKHSCAAWLKFNPLLTTGHWRPKEFRTVLWHDYCLSRAQIFPLSWCSINHLVCVKKFQVTLSLLCQVTYKQCNFQQIKLSISMTPLLTFSACLVILCLLVYILEHLRMAIILFGVNIYYIVDFSQYAN